MSAPEGQSLVEAVVAASGLSPVFARGAISRALSRAGLDPAQLNRRDLKRALPAITSALKVFLPEAELESRLREIDRLAG